MTNAQRSHPGRRVLLTALKLVIAVIGLWWVLRQISWQDRAVVAAGQTVRSVTFVQPTRLPLVGRSADNVTLDFYRQKIRVRLPTGKIITGYACQAPLNFPRTLALPRTYLAHVDGQAEIETGMESLLQHANVWLLLAALPLLGIPFLLTGWRWQLLLWVQDLHLSYAQCLRLTFVGQFYSTFLPGTTSGDVVKIVYTARATGKTTPSAITVLLDRVIGLIALVVVAGVAAALQLLFSGAHTGGTDPVLVHVLLLAAGLLAATALAGVVYFSARLRKKLGVEALLNWLPLPEFIKHADRSLRAYRDHVGVLLTGLGISLLSQSALPIAAFLAGRAFGMHASFGCFMAYVPLAVLAASLPIMPPQGIGVMEAILLHFFVTRGVDTASQSFALAQAVRFLPICWNLVGAYWVVRGKFHRPSAAEVARVELDAAEPG